jgi:NAD+ synthase
MTMPTTTMSSADAASLADQISGWLREQFEITGAERFILGLSGGIDSAVVAGLCARAVGPEKVLGVMMPSASNPDDVVAAQSVADAFGIKVTTLDLTDIAETVFEAMPDAATLYSEVLGENEAPDIGNRSGLARANVRPRLRMISLYYLANLSGGVVVGTGNRSELMIGYFTKHGDGGVDLFPLTDLYKFEVRAVAKEIGVPDVVITRPPSAGLWEGQTDENEIGLTYEVLDTTLQAIDGGETADVDPDVLAKVQRMISVTHHKRTAAPSFSRKHRDGSQA